MKTIEAGGMVKLYKDLAKISPKYSTLQADTATALDTPTHAHTDVEVGANLKKLETQPELKLLEGPKKVLLLEGPKPQPYIHGKNYNPGDIVVIDTKQYVIQPNCGEAGSGYKHYAEVHPDLLQKEIDWPIDSKVQTKFNSHKKHFGMEKNNWSNPSKEIFKQRIIEHISDPDTIPIAGRYARSKQDVVHYFNPKTKLNVMKSMDGKFISGWELSDEQITYLQIIGKIGGDNK
jgi:hypothetical protein